MPRLTFRNSSLHLAKRIFAHLIVMSPKIDFESMEGDLSDERIEELLCNAERRLKGEVTASLKQHAAQGQQK